MYVVYARFMFLHVWYRLREASAYKVLVAYYYCILATRLLRREGACEIDSG